MAYLRSGAAQVIPAAAAFTSEVGFMAYNTSLANWVSVAANDECTFNTERYDIGSNFNHTSSGTNPSPYRFEAPATGLYYFFASIYTGYNDASSSYGFFLDGSKSTNLTGSGDQDWGHAAVNGATIDETMTMSAVYYLTSGEEISVGAFQTSNDFGPGESFFTGCRIW